MRVNVFKTPPHESTGMMVAKSARQFRRHLQGPDGNTILHKVVKSPYVNGPELQQSFMKGMYTLDQNDGIFLEFLVLCCSLMSHISYFTKLKRSWPKTYHVLVQ